MISSGVEPIAQSHIIVDMHGTGWIHFNLFTNMTDMDRDDRPYFKRFFLPGMAENLFG